jgi:hypothetical protein
MMPFHRLWLGIRHGVNPRGVAAHEIEAAESMHAKHWPAVALIVCSAAGQTEQAILLRAARDIGDTLE